MFCRLSKPMPENYLEVFHSESAKPLDQVMDEPIV